jgi:RHS repeat-associated protein
VLLQQHWVPGDDEISSYNYTQDTYTYDALNRIQSAIEVHGTPASQSAQDYSQVFSYDRWGNRTINPSSWGVGINTKQFTVNTANNRLGVPSGESGVMTYDNAGNLTTDTYTGMGSRTYDAENRMTTATDNFNQTSRYTYDAEGRRTRRQVASSQEKWQVYGFDGELIAEYPASASPATPEKEYGYRNGQLLVTAEPVAAQSVSWTNMVGVSGNGNSLTKTAATGWGNAGATSAQSITAGDGYVELTVPDTTTHRFLGLSNGNSNADYSDVDFAIHPVVGGTIFIYEGGVSRGTFGSYSTGDVLRVAVEGGVVKYRKNGALLYTSSITPTYPLLVDSALYGTGDTLSNVVISGASGGASSSIHWLVADHLGTPRMIIDQAGTLANIKRHDYLPFGEELFAPTGGRTAAHGYASGDGVRQQFTAKERDIETGLDYFGARYYGSMMGRFTSADPLLASGRASVPQSWNRYSYALDNPVRLTDPSGLEDDDPQKPKPKRNPDPPQPTPTPSEPPLPKVTVRTNGTPNGTEARANIQRPDGTYVTGVVAPLTVTITDQSGKPLSGLTVTETNDVIKAQPQLPFSQNPSTVTTDANGSFTDVVYGNSTESQQKVSPSDATKIVQNQVENPVEVVTRQTLTISSPGQGVIATAVYERTYSNLDSQGNLKPPRDSTGRHVNNISINVTEAKVSRPKSP